MANQSDYLGAATNRLMAGGAIAANDLVTVGPDGFAFGSERLQVADYAAQAAGAASIVAQTSVSVNTIPALNGQAVLQGPEGSIYVLLDNTGGQGCTINRYTPTGGAGVPLGALVLSTNAVNLSTPVLLLLNNNTVAAVWTEGTTTGAIKFAIVDLDLNVIKTITAVETAKTTSLWAIALTGGGFAVSYQQNATSTLMRLAIYDNTGAALGASPVTFQTFGAVGTAAQSTMAQLSNGNIVIGTVSSSNTASSKGLWFTVVTALGIGVVAPTNWALTTTECDYLPSVNAFGGYFCMVGSAVTAVLQVGVFTNAGVQQSTTYATGVAYTGGNGYFVLLNDGTQFWLAYNGSTGVFGLLKIPTTGTGQLLTLFAVLVNSLQPITCFIERGYLVGLVSFPAANTVNKFFVIRLFQNGLSVPQIVVALTNLGSAPGTTGSLYPKIIPGGNFTLIAYYDYQNSGSLKFLVTKYAPASVAGVASGSATAGTTVPLAAGNIGSQPCNYVAGTSPTAFDHTAATIVGPKGQLLNYAVKTTQVG